MSQVISHGASLLANFFGVGFIVWLNLLRGKSRKLLRQTFAGISDNFPPLIQNVSGRGGNKTDVPEEVEWQFLETSKINSRSAVNLLRIDTACLRFGASRSSLIEVLVQVDDERECSSAYRS